MKTELTVLPDVAGNELTIREGKALELKEPVKIAISGDITAVANYLEKRNADAISIDVVPFENSGDWQPVYKNLSLVVVDKEKQTIQLQVSPNNAYGTVITGELKDSEEIKAFHINETYYFERQALLKLFRFNKRFFSDLDLHQTLIDKLTKLKVDSTVNSNVGNDNRGNRNASIDKVVNTDLPTGFFLIIPMFKNQDAVKFFVELNLDTSEGATRFWLDSVELVEIHQQKIDEIFNNELQACDGLVIINK